MPTPPAPPSLPPPPDTSALDRAPFEARAAYVQEVLTLLAQQHSPEICQEMGLLLLDTLYDLAARTAFEMAQWEERVARYVAGARRWRRSTTPSATTTNHERGVERP